MLPRSILGLVIGNQETTQENINSEQQPDIVQRGGAEHTGDGGRHAAVAARRAAPALGAEQLL